jgi:hypothetical protein
MSAAALLARVREQLQDRIRSVDVRLPSMPVEVEEWQQGPYADEVTSAKRTVRELLVGLPSFGLPDGALEYLVMSLVLDGHCFEEDEDDLQTDVYARAVAVVEFASGCRRVDANNRTSFAGMRGPL